MQPHICKVLESTNPTTFLKAQAWKIEYSIECIEGEERVDRKSFRGNLVRFKFVVHK